jgi:hypothetical protein
MKLHTQILCLAIALILVSCSSIPPKENFKEYCATVYEIEDGTKIKSKEWRFVQEYDERGEVSKILYYDDDIDTLSRYTERHLNPKSGMVTHTSFDASGRKEGWSEALLKNNKVVLDKTYDSKGVLIQVIKSKFDGQGRQIEMLYLKGNGDVLQKLVYEYDDKENTKTRTMYDADGQQKPGKIVNKYDDNKNLIRSDWYDSTEIFLTSDYTYREGKRRAEIQSSFGKVFKKETYKYDKMGNIKETLSYEPNKDNKELILREIRISDYKY